MRYAIAIGVFIGMIGCGSISPAVDGGSGGAGGEGGNAGAAADASGDGCAAPTFVCSGVQGGCAAGEEAATHIVCDLATAVCCPANVCDPAQCH